MDMHITQPTCYFLSIMEESSSSVHEEHMLFFFSENQKWYIYLENVNMQVLFGRKS